MSKGKRVFLAIALFGLALAAIGLLLALVPPLLIPDGKIDASERARLLSESALRSTTLQLIAGLVVVAGITYTAAQFGISRETHYTDRYTKAVDQLGHESAAVRLGGIFALQRLAMNSSTDLPTVVEVLSGYLHTTARRPQTPGPPAVNTEKRQLDPDVQAAVTVLIALHANAG